MSRCTPNLGWNRRLKRHGGFEGIIASRADQFQKLATTKLDAEGTVEAFRIKTMLAEADPESIWELKKAQNKIELVAIAVDHLNGNPRRVLSSSIEEALGWR
jgi:hypothetical protein